MSVTVQWLVPDYILYACYAGELTADDIAYQYAEGLRMSESVDTPLVHLIADVSEVTSFPKSIQAYKGAYGEKARNAGWVLLVGENKIARLISTVISNLMQLRFSYVNTIDEALQFIAQRDSAIQLDEARHYTAEQLSQAEASVD